MGHMLCGGRKVNVEAVVWGSGLLGGARLVIVVVARKSTAGMRPHDMRRTIFVILFSAMCGALFPQSHERYENIIACTADDIGLSGNLKKREAEPSPTPMPLTKYNTNCMVRLFVGSQADDFWVPFNSSEFGDEEGVRFYLIDENGNLPKVLGSSNRAEKSLVYSMSSPGLISDPFLPPMDIRAGKQYRIVHMDFPTSAREFANHYCSQPTRIEWDELDLTAEALESACEVGSLKFSWDNQEPVARRVPHIASDAELAQHAALANQWEFPIAGESEVHAPTPPPPTFLRLAGTSSHSTRSGIIPVIFDGKRIQAVRAYRNTEPPKSVLVSFPCTPTNPGRSGEIGIRPPRRTAYFHLLLRPSGRHAGPDGTDSMMSGWSLYGPYSLETQDGCHPEDVEVPVTREGRPISPEDMRAFQRDGSFPIDIVYE
jgi:hypothetical protein